MAQKLKFGNGTWATKKGSTLAYNDENNNYKPLPFTTTRDSIATRVNKEGLIEVVGNDVPRIDYTDSADGVLLLENSSTNLITYSEDFSDGSWIKTRSSISSNLAISPDGTLNAGKLIEDTSTNTHSTQNNVTIGNVDTTISVFVKADTRSRVRFILTDLTTGDYRVDLNLNNLSVIENNGGGRGSWTNTSYKIENFTNNWYKVSLTATKGAGSQASLSINLLDNSGNHVYTGDGTSGIYVWGAQLESGNLSSYIPTYGSTVQRAAETCNESGNSEVFSDSSGVLFADSATLVEGEDVRIIGLSDGSTNNRISITYHSTENRIQIYGSKNGTIFNLEYLNAIKTDYNKIAIKYNASSVDFYYNGFLVDTEVPSDMFDANILNSLNFDRIDNNNNFYGKTKEIAYYDEILTDLELETLTSYRSLSELVTELNLNTL